MRIAREGVPTLHRSIESKHAWPTPALGFASFPAAPNCRRHHLRRIVARRLDGAPGIAGRATPGFVLLELLVVLVLVGLAAALVLPNLERLQAAVTGGAERDYILDQISGLGWKAISEQRSYVIFGNDRAQDAGFSSSVRSADDTAPEGPDTRSDWHASDAASLASYEPLAINLPEGWELRLDEPLVIRANGVCLGAGLALYHRGVENLRIDLDPPYCHVDPDV